MGLGARVSEFNFGRQGLPKMKTHDLKRIYVRGGVRYKRIVTKTRRRRVDNDETRARDARMFEELHHQITRSKDDGTEVIMVDESVFSQRSCNTSAWAGPG